MSTHNIGFREEIRIPLLSDDMNPTVGLVPGFQSFLKLSRP